MPICLVSGATGFIGQAVIARLKQEGHSVIAAVRRLDHATHLGSHVEAIAIHDERALTAAMARASVVVNLAGESIATRWTSRHREAIRESRVGVTETLVRAMKQVPSSPRVFVSASAVGIYGDRDGEVLTEQSTQGKGFLADICREWEQAAAASPAGTRVIHTRFGVVLGCGGGALGKMLPVFRAGLGGPLAGGAQYFPWIHLNDVTSAISFLLQRDDLKGAINVVAPEAVTQKQFAETLAASLHTSARVPTPALALKVMLGEAATVLTSSQRVVPSVLSAAKFTFAYPTLAQALRDVK